MIGRPKGGKNRKYTVEEKLSIVNMNLQDHMSIIQIEKETGISDSLISAWIHKYLDNGLQGLENKKNKKSRRGGSSTRAARRPTRTTITKPRG